MPTVKKIFSVARLKIGDQPFSTASFDAIEASSSEERRRPDGVVIHHKIIQKEILDGRFVSIYSEEGSSTPRPDIVYNGTIGDDEQNPRRLDQIERGQQTFILIDTQEQKIFLSDFRKKSTIENWLRGSLRRADVLIKDIIDRQHFTEGIKAINRLYFAASPSLLSRTGTLSGELNNDIHNYGVEVQHVGVEINFSHSNTLPSILKEKVLGLIRQNEDGMLDKLEVAGRYDNGFERVFNAEEVIDKVEVEIVLGPSGILDKDAVFHSLILKIQS